MIGGCIEKRQSAYNGSLSICQEHSFEFCSGFWVALFHSFLYINKVNKGAELYALSLFFCMFSFVSVKQRIPQLIMNDYMLTL